MAAKKGDAALGYLVIIGAALIFLMSVIALATPILLLVIFLYNSYKSAAIKNSLEGDMSDFWLSDGEKSTYFKKFAEHQEADEIIREANDLGASEGVSRNKDGSFSSRSNLGKELKSTIALHEPSRRAALSYLLLSSELPITRWKQFSDYLRRSAASLLAILAWVGTLVYYSMKFGRESLWNAINPYIAMVTNIFEDELGQIEVSDADWESVMVASLVAIVSYFLMKWLYRNAARTYTPKPESVSIDNIDLY